MRDDHHPILPVKTEWSFADFAEMKGLSPASVRKQIERGKLPEGYEVFAYSPQKKVIRFVGIKSVEPVQQMAQLSTRHEAVTREEIARKATLKEWIYFRESTKMGGGTYSLADDNFILHFNTLKMYPAEYTILGEISLKTLYRWLNDSKRGDLRPELMGRKLGDTLDEIEKKLLEKFWLMPESHCKEACIRYTIKALEEQGYNWIKSSKTYQRYITEYTKLNYSTVMMCRRGRKAMIDNTVPSIFRNTDLIEVGDLLVLDGHTTNFDIINPATGKPQRMTLLMVIDMKSGVPVGFEIMPTENIYAITSAIRRAILTLKFKPKVILLDNGRANRSVGKNKNQKVHKTDWYNGEDMIIGEGILQRIGIDAMFAKPYNAQAKLVERFFSDFLEFEKQMPTYVGNSIQNKPARLMRNEKLHRSLYAEKMEYMGGGITLEQAMISIALWVNEYAKRELTSGRNKGKTRGEIFANGIDNVINSEAYESRIATSQELEELMMRDEVRTLYRNGIKFRGRYYWNDHFFRLQRGEGKFKFIIRYDLAYPSKIFVYDKTGFVCEAIEPQMQHPVARLLGTEDDQLRLQTALRNQQRLTAQAEAEASEKLRDLVVPVNISETSRGSEATKIKAAEKQKTKKKKEQKEKEPPKTQGLYDWTSYLLTPEELKEQLTNRSTP